MMVDETDILILDEDQFFADGLRGALRENGRLPGRASRFIQHPEEMYGPCVIFFTLTTSHRLPAPLLHAPAGHCRLVCLLPRQLCEQPALPGLPWVTVLHREAPVAALRTLFRRPFPAERCPALPRLTVREIRILRYLKAGMRANGIARLMAVSPKTLSAHKRRAMEKLGMRSTRLLLLWLSGPGQLYLTSLPPSRDTLALTRSTGKEGLRDAG